MFLTIAGDPAPARTADETARLGTVLCLSYAPVVKDSIFAALGRAARGDQSVALGIITGVKGSSPQKLGAKALFSPDRTIHGTLGGGCLEAEVQRLALQSLQDGKPKTFELVLDHDFGWDDGLICGGKVSGLILPNAQRVGERFWNQLATPESAVSWGVQPDFTISLAHSTAAEWRYVEAITPPCALWIAGSGHIAQAVAPLASQLDFTVTVFDDRPELANQKFFASDIFLRTGPWGELLATPLPAVAAFGLIVTRGHKHDALVLETWIHHPFAFLGMIGSTRKARTIHEHFLAKQLATPDELARVACPVGMRIRSRTVMEIAVDILAQYIDKRAAALAAAGVAPPAKQDVTL